MSSDEEKSTSPVFPNDFVQDSSVSSDPQDEYEELFRYTVVTPKFEQCVSKFPEPASEKRPSERIYRLTGYATHHNTPVSTSVKQAGMEQPALPETTSSTHGPGEVSKTTVTELTSPDGKVTQIENIVDLWSGSLKTNILTELKTWELNLIQQHKLQMSQEKEKHDTQVKQLQNEMENLKELLRTYEISISRKDEVITNLTQALEKQKERVALMRKFTLWRIQHVKAKQEEYAIRMADKHFQTALMKKVWAAWRSVSEEKWKDKVARACQLKAEDVCVQLTNDFEAKIAELTAALELTRSELLQLHSERDQYEDTMKKAFMRGVCALNLEAMTMFQSKDSRPDPDTGSRRNDHATTGAGRPPPSQYNQPSPPPPPAAAVQVENMFCCHLAHASTPETRLDSDSPVIITSTTSGSGVTSTQKLSMPKVITSAQQKAGRTITARITGRADMGQKSRASGSLAVMGVAPPMSSVIVEKHHPVTQQTISQATAAKYPRTVLHSSGSTFARPAGQAGRVLQSQTHTSVQSIKVVD
ncbi:centrosomal protein POC5 isoform X1 [Ammospiza nelsoni]|uniref:centrosomal protein POC5 isoform X1 n=2 Tax=Ammospiza nelsoni TaxID=2857394 RepID=UPI00286AC067|nr:centrosomal protein POC5 isoform X1 [Ammospiza nelsoni]XP_059347998.1 centrosomal protein POC5 isoform X1 [Ammospiza nelsoni]